MRTSALLVLFIIFSVPSMLRAQQTDSPETLNDTQKEGRLLFQQRCPICHSMVMITRHPYAPILFKGRVVGNEDRVRETIENGRPGKMPAFKYGMSPAEINSIIEYLKTVTAPFEMHPPKVQPPAGNGNAAPRANE